MKHKEVKTTYPIVLHDSLGPQLKGTKKMNCLRQTGLYKLI